MIISASILLSIALIGVILSAGSRLWMRKLDPRILDQVSGVPGVYDPATATYKVSMDRAQLAARVDGVLLTGALGMVAQMTLSGTLNQAILLGEFPLREDEVSSFLQSVVDEGVTVTALHNKFMMDSPRIMSMHIEGIGTESRMAKAMGRLYKDLTALKPSLESPPKNAVDISKSSLVQKRMEELLWKGQMINGVYRLALGRGTKVGGQPLGGSVGVESWATFAGSEENALVNGDIATLEFELPYVLKDLLKAHIQILSIHSHLYEERPRLIFVHYWGTGKLPDLAAGVKAAFWEKEHFQSQ